VPLKYTKVVFEGLIPIYNAAISVLELYERVTRKLEAAFVEIEARAPRPSPVEIKSMVAFRYDQPGLKAALIQRLARVISGLHAARILLAAGYAQEVGAIQRMIDEFDQDIWFLSYPILQDVRSDLHGRFLDEMFREDFPDPTNPTLESIPDSNPIPRKKIRAAIQNWSPIEKDPSSRILESKVVSNSYGGFVHGRSARIMEMYFGARPRFHLSGMKGSQAVDNHTKDLWNQVFRGCINAQLVALALRLPDIATALAKVRRDFELESGGQPRFE